MSDIKLRWSEAVLACAVMDMELAVPRNTAENDQLAKLISQSNLKQPIWLGISDIFQHGRFVNLQGTKFIILILLETESYFFSIINPLVTNAPQVVRIQF